MTWGLIGALAVFLWLWHIVVTHLFTCLLHAWLGNPRRTKHQVV